MNKVKQNLIKRAKRAYTYIYPCGSRSSLSECFTPLEDGKKVAFWFNTRDNSTHVLVEEINS